MLKRKLQVRPAGLPPGSNIPISDLISTNSRCNKKKSSQLPRRYHVYRKWSMLVSLIAFFYFAWAFCFIQEKEAGTISTEIRNEMDSFTNVENMYFCGWPFAKQLHSSFFPEHADKLHSAIELSSSEDSYKTLQRATKRDWLVSGGVEGCIKSIGRLGSVTEIKWNEWLRKNFKGTYIVYNGEGRGGEQWIMNKSKERHFHIGYGHDSCRSISMPYVAAYINDVDKKGITPSLLLEKKAMSTKEHFLIYINSHCIGFREDAFVRIALAFKEKLIYNGGKCNGTKVSDHLLQKQLEDIRNIKTYGGHERRFHFQNKNMTNKFRFCLVMENTKIDGYITEKILNAFLGGCIPIYYGAEDIFHIFNRNAFIYYNVSDPTVALDRISHLEMNQTAYDEVINEPILVNGRETIENYMTLNGTLKTRIREMVKRETACIKESETGKIRFQHWLGF